MSMSEEVRRWKCYQAWADWEDAQPVEPSGPGKSYKLDISFLGLKETPLTSTLETFIRNAFDAISTSEETVQNITLTCSIDTVKTPLTSLEDLVEQL